MIISPPLAARGLKPIAVLGARRQHGDRLRYMSGCRCADCRRANSAYECMRARARRNGDWNGIVAARKAQAHMRELSRQGVGRNTVAASTDIPRSILAEIRSGKRRNIRARTERKILAVTKAQAADRAFVSAARTWRLIDQLIEEGFSKAFLAICLGYATPRDSIQQETRDRAQRAPGRMPLQGIDGVSKAIHCALFDLAIHARRWRASARKDLLERALAKERLLSAIARVDAVERNVAGGGKRSRASQQRLSDSARAKLP